MPACCFRLSNGESVSSYCKRNNLNYATAFRYMDRDGLSPEQAVEKTKEIKQKGRYTPVINLDTGETFTTAKECAEKLKTSRFHLYVNLAKGYKTKGQRIIRLKDYKNEF